MGKNNNQVYDSPQQENEIEQHEQVSDYEDADDYVTRDQLKQELKNKISDVKGNQKIAFAALYQIYQKQQLLDDEEDKQIESIKQKYRAKTEDVLNKIRNVVSGESTQNVLISNSEFLNQSEKSKQLKTISIPNFWSLVVKNSSFGALICKQQESAINNIKNIFVSYSSETKTINIQITFAENQVFSNSILKASLTQEPTNLINHTFDTPNYKPQYIRPENGFLNLFTQLPEQQTIGFFEYWLNFYQQEIPHALAYYFELKQGIFHSKVPIENFDNRFDQENHEQQDQ